MTPQPYRLVVAASAEGTLGRLPERIAAAVVEFVVGPLLERPGAVGHPLRHELEGLYSARRGPYRIVYEIGIRSARALRRWRSTTPPACGGRRIRFGL